MVSFFSAGLLAMRHPPAAKEPLIKYCFERDRLQAVRKSSR